MNFKKKLINGKKTLRSRASLDKFKLFFEDVKNKTKGKK